MGIEVLTFQTCSHISSLTRSTLVKISRICYQSHRLFWERKSPARFPKFMSLGFERLSYCPDFNATFWNFDYLNGFPGTLIILMRTERWEDCSLPNALIYITAFLIKADQLLLLKKKTKNKKHKVFFSPLFLFIHSFIHVFIFVSVNLLKCTGFVAGV